jgi:hypothetical protein
VLGRIVKDYGTEIIDLIGPHKTAYVVIGRLILSNTTSATMMRSSYERSWSLSASIDATTVGVPVSVSAGVSNPGVEYSHATTSTSRDAFVYALQYARLRLDTELISRRKYIHADGYAKGQKYDKMTFF